jgi:hypothetical protein
MMEKYGVEHAMQNAILLNKQQASCFKDKYYTFPSGKIGTYHGYEDRCLDILLRKFSEKDIIIGNVNVPAIWYTLDNQKHRYYMDAYITSKQRAIEVKSTWTYKLHKAKDRAKWIATSTKCEGGLYVYIFDAKRIYAVQKIKNGRVEKLHVWGKFDKHEGINPFDLPN